MVTFCSDVWTFTSSLGAVVTRGRGDQQPFLLGKFSPIHPVVLQSYGRGAQIRAAKRLNTDHVARQNCAKKRRIGRPLLASSRTATAS
jgi:hypothetical protein